MKKYLRTTLTIALAMSLMLVSPTTSLANTSLDERPCTNFKDEFTGGPHYNYTIVEDSDGPGGITFSQDEARIKFDQTIYPYSVIPFVQAIGPTINSNHYTAEITLKNTSLEFQTTGYDGLHIGSATGIDLYNTDANTGLIDSIPTVSLRVGGETINVTGATMQYNVTFAIPNNNNVHTPKIIPVSNINSLKDAKLSIEVQKMTKSKHVVKGYIKEVGKSKQLIGTFEVYKNDGNHGFSRIRSAMFGGVSLRSQRVSAIKFKANLDNLKVKDANSSDAPSCF